MNGMRCVHACPASEHPTTLLEHSLGACNGCNDTPFRIGKGCLEQQCLKVEALSQVRLDQQTGIPLGEDSRILREASLLEGLLLTVIREEVHMAKDSIQAWDQEHQVSVLEHLAFLS